MSSEEVGARFAPSPEVALHLSELTDDTNRALDEATQWDDNCPRRLFEAARYSLLAPGKRLRPILVGVAAELCGGDLATSRAARVAIECVHAYSLIHDDLPAMDDDDLRRGRPTCHKRFDEATAILAGDALLTFAFETLAAGIPNGDASRLCALTLARAAGPCGMVGGQADDVAWSSSTQSSPCARDLIEEVLAVGRDARTTDAATARLTCLGAFLSRVYRRKTGALIAAAAELGARTASANAEQLAALLEYGVSLGDAFQLADDLLDVEGDEATVGKRVRKDADACKLTSVSLYGVEETKRRLTDRVARARAALNDARDVFAHSTAPAFETAIFLAEYIARRDK